MDPYDGAKDTVFNRCERNLLLLVRGISTLTNKRGEKEYLHHQTEFRMEIESDFIFRRSFLPEFKNARARFTVSMTISSMTIS